MTGVPDCAPAAVMACEAARQRDWECIGQNCVQSPTTIRTPIPNAIDTGFHQRAGRKSALNAAAANATPGAASE